VLPVVAAAPARAVKSIAGVSKKGFAPYNPLKRNQDAMLMELDDATESLLFGVFDGHGEVGDLVSHFFSERLAQLIFSHAAFKTDVPAALADSLATLEKQLLQGAAARRGARRGAENSAPARFL
jgi:serine/threonine protein phosphatase PrpC